MERLHAKPNNNCKQLPESDITPKFGGICPLTPKFEGIISEFQDRGLILNL